MDRTDGLTELALRVHLPPHRGEVVLVEGEGMVEESKLPLLKWLAKSVVAELFSYRPVCRLLCWRLARRSGKVALTFDDGPSPTYTREVLDVLDRKKVRATFFVLGESIEENPRVFQDIVDAGHEIGVHGYNHTLVDLGGQTRRTLDILSRFGVKSSLFRPPHGVLAPGTGFWMLRNRMSVVLWSIDARDSLRHEKKTAPDSHDSFDRIRGGDIVLLHDDNPQCAMDVREILGVLDHQKLAPVPVTELLSAN